MNIQTAAQYLKYHLELNNAPLHSINVKKNKIVIILTKNYFIPEFYGEFEVEKVVLNKVELKNG